ATVSTTRDCPWTIESQASWIKVSPNSGQGQTVVNLEVAENPVAIERSTTLVVSATSVTVTQKAAECRFELGSSSSRITADGGRFTVSVFLVPGVQWG